MNDRPNINYVCLKKKKTCDVGILTLHHSLPVQSVITDPLDVAEMDVTEEDTVGSLSSTSSVIKSERNDVLHVLGVLERFNGRIQVVFIRQVDTLQYGALRVEQVAVIVPAAASVFSQHAMGAGTCTLPVATEKAKLLAPAIVVFAHVCSCAQTFNASSIPSSTIIQFLKKCT